ncbi:hypothetical protein TNCV_960531 [Trichonephila clavipes]|nr:hypothetical protein TNCV_960531 [Trichonephila clavipes]
MQKYQEDLKNALEKKIDNVEEKIKSMEEKIALKVEEKIAVVEEKIKKKVEQVEERIREQVDERIEEVDGNFSQRVENPEKKLLACEKMNENKFVPTSAVPVPASPVSVKLSTYDGKTNSERKSRRYIADSFRRRATEFELSARNTPSNTHVCRLKQDSRKPEKAYWNMPPKSPTWLSPTTQQLCETQSPYSILRTA